MGDEILPLILKRLAFTSLDDLYAAIGYGGVTATRTVNRIRDEILRNQKANQKNAIDRINEAAERRNKRARHAVHGILVEGLDNCLIKFSRCCTPVPGDSIIGFITRGAGVSIHRTDCENYLASRDNPETAGRWIRVSWAGAHHRFLQHDAHAAQRTALGSRHGRGHGAQHAQRQGAHAHRARRGQWPLDHHDHRRGARSGRAAHDHQPPERRPRRHPHLAQRCVRHREGHRKHGGAAGRACQKRQKAKQEGKV